MGETCDAIIMEDDDDSLETFGSGDNDGFPIVAGERDAGVEVEEVSKDSIVVVTA